jgi:copper homeostasis protein
MSRITLEICVDEPAGLAAAITGGADRIELCAALGLGGLTPSPGLIAAAGACPVPVMVMIRPRAGGFHWSEAELACMEAEIAAVRTANLAGVVIGASQPDGRLDNLALARLMAAAQGLDVTLHRAIDLAPDPGAAMREVAALGIRRVLSSGGALRAPEGLQRLARMRAAAPQIGVMPGAGLNAENIASVAAALPGLREVHASCAEPVAADPQLDAFGFTPSGAKRTSARHVAAMRAALNRIGSFA